MYGYFTTSRIWLRNAYSGQFWGVFGDYFFMSYRYELACKGHSTEKAQDLVT